MSSRRPKIHNVHDLAWRKLLENRTALQNLLKDYLPEILSIVKRLVLNRAKIERTSYIEKTIRALYSDIIWKIPFRRKQDCLVYVLVEHQSAPERLMALRVLRYIGALYGSIVKEAGVKKSSSSSFALPVVLPVVIPVVIPVVLYCGAEEWRVPIHLKDLLSYELPVKEPFVAARYCLIDVNRLSERMLLHTRNALSGLFLLEKGRLSGTMAYFESAIECLGAERDHNLLVAVVVTAYNILKERGDRRSPKKIRAWFRTQRAKDHDMAQTMREYLRKVGLEEGMRRGLERALSSLRKTLRRRGVSPEPYESDFEKLTDPGKVVDLAVSFMRAKDPRAYLKRRFGH